MYTHETDTCVSVYIYIYIHTHMTSTDRVREGGRAGGREHRLQTTGHRKLWPQGAGGVAALFPELQPVTIRLGSGKDLGF